MLPCQASACSTIKVQKASIQRLNIENGIVDAKQTGSKSGDKLVSEALKPL